MTTSSPALQAPSAAYQSCVDEVLRQSPFLINRWCSGLAQAMHVRAIAVFDIDEKRQIEAAIALVKKHQDLIGKSFPIELKKFIDEDSASGLAKKPSGAARSLSSVSFDELELMGDKQVQKVVESARLHQLIRLTCQSGLAGFSARLSTAQGLLVVKADKNPLRPEIVTQALLSLLQTLPLTSQARACWLLDGAQPLADELQLLYLSLDDFLSAQGVAPAAYSVTATHESKIEIGFRRDKADAFQISQVDQLGKRYEPAKPVSKEALISPARKELLTLDHLHHLLVGDYDDSTKGFSSFSDYGSEEVVHRDFSHTLPTALEALSELEEKGLATTQERAERPAPSQPVAQMRAHLKTRAKSLGQSLAIEVVGLMIEQMAHDERLLLPVRQVIANAEPAFLRLAVTDPRFFSDKNHPARKLLEAITSTSLGYASEHAPGFSDYLQNLQEVAMLLTEEHASDSQHFAGLLLDFERKLARDTPESRQTQRSAVQALLQAEQRNLLAVKIAVEIRARPDFFEVNRVITAFLTGPWAQVMAQERLLGEYGGPGSTQAVFSLTLGDVLWSLDTAKASSHSKRLFKIIPDMLKSLRDGLMSIDFPLEQARPFFEHLMAIHQAGLQARPDVPPAPPQSGHAMGKMFESQDEDESDDDQPWLAPVEARNSGFMQDWDDTVNRRPELDLLKPLGGSKTARGGQQAAGEAIELHLDDWVELFVDAQWLRAQLTWISPHNTLFMFTSEGGRKHSMTARLLQHFLVLELVKVVSQQGVFDGALDKVARTAMLNSVQRDT